MRCLRCLHSIESTVHGLTAAVDDEYELRVTALEEDIVRIWICERGAVAVRRSWMVAPGADDLAPEGRARESVDGFSLPPVHVRTNGDTSAVVSTSRLQCSLASDPLRIDFFWRSDTDSGWRSLQRDRQTGAYYVGDTSSCSSGSRSSGSSGDERVRHYTQRIRGDAFFGLGEKSGELDRAGRRFVMDCTDAMGYDAEHSDPLYKCWPFYIRRGETLDDAAAAAHGLFYDNMSSSTFDFGCEVDNYHGPFSSFKASGGHLDYYVLLGPEVAQVTKRFSWLTGRTLMPPRWSLGYSGSTMIYTDAENAQERLMEFLSLCSAHAIPCSSFQLSSGYTSIGGKRYVFNWNRSKVPEPQRLAAAFKEAGLRIAANIKPCLLTDHPRYAEAAAAGLFLRSGQQASEPETSMFWGSRGSHIDFTNPAAGEWWRANVTEQLLQLGIESTWNDNNEYRLEDERATCQGFGSPMAMRLVRPVQTLLMLQNSFEAQRRHRPEERPWLISRSGMPGMQRYAQTWTGDNYTEWKTIRFNLRMGLGLSLSGCYNFGHDVGGFDGPPPEAELLVRWVQNGIFHPRFTIHSWNTDGSVNEPWMHPEVTPLVRDAIRFRYSLIPYLYSLLLRAHLEYEPVLRPTFLDHEADPTTWRACDDFMLGRALLVASVMERGARSRTVYLPANVHGWWDWHDGRWYAPGQEVTLDAPLDRIPLLAAAGSMVPLAEGEARTALDGGAKRTLRLFPLPGEGIFQFEWQEDDGVTTGWVRGERMLIRFEANCSLTCVSLHMIVREFDHRFRPAFSEVRVLLPAEERRGLFLSAERRDGPSIFRLSGVCPSSGSALHVHA